MCTRQKLKGSACFWVSKIYPLILGYDVDNHDLEYEGPLFNLASLMLFVYLVGLLFN